MTDGAVGNAGRHVIQFEHVSKRYRIGDGSARLPLEASAGELTGDDDLDDDDLDDDVEVVVDRERRDARDVWALDDVSFAVAAGVSLGVLGADGSGKTTLLKVLARITPPTRGQITVHGRVAPLIGVVSSFLQMNETGAKNVRLLGRLFGVPRSIIEARLPEVFAFAELEGRENVKLKRYSSGLTRRLAFSAVLNLEPDILLADEVLAVGDVSFQQRCFVKIQEAREQGLTLVLATHDLALVEQFCSTVLWMEHGRVVDLGPADEVVARRARAVLPQGTGASTRRWKPSFNEHAALQDGAIRSQSGDVVEAVNVEEESFLQILVEAAQPGVCVACVVKLYRDGELFLRLAQPEPVGLDVAGPYIVTARLPPELLREGSYTVRLSAIVSAVGIESPLVRGDAFSFEAYSDAEPDLAADIQVSESPEIEWTVERHTSLTLDPRVPRPGVINPTEPR